MGLPLTHAEEHRPLKKVALEREIPKLGTAMTKELDILEKEMSKAINVVCVLVSDRADKVLNSLKEIGAIFGGWVGFDPCP